MLPATLLPMAWACYAHAADLIVHVDHIVSDRGFVCMALYRAASNYLASDDAQAFRLGKLAARTQGVTLSFHELPPGRYAIKVFQDENNDGKMNRNFFGAPTEPYGISNNARARFSLPPFRDALIAVNASVTETRIELASH